MVAHVPLADTSQFDNRVAIHIQVWMGNSTTHTQQLLFSSPRQPSSHEVGEMSYIFLTFGTVCGVAFFQHLLDNVLGSI